MLIREPGQSGLHRNRITRLDNETAAGVDLDAIDKLCELFGIEVVNGSGT
jgi:DNA-binding Xre family transcriptional regulator